MTIGLQTNVYGEPIEPCNFDPVTGFYRTGCCETGGDDTGSGRAAACSITGADFEHSSHIGAHPTGARPVQPHRDL